MKFRKLFVLWIILGLIVPSAAIASEKGSMKAGMMEMEGSADAELESGMKSLKSKMDNMKDTVVETAEEGMEKVQDMVAGEAAEVMDAPVYTVDVSHSTLGFAVKHMVVGTTRGSFGEYEGKIHYNPNNQDDFHAEVTINAASIDTKNVDRDKHLRNEDFFGVETYPTIKFVSTRLDKTAAGLAIVGNLTMKDVTKEISVPVEISGPVKSPYGMDVIGINGAITINRQDYNISWSKNLDTGGLVVGDDVKLIIELEAQNK